MFDGASMKILNMETFSFCLTLLKTVWFLTSGTIEKGSTYRNPEHGLLAWRKVSAGLCVNNQLKPVFVEQKCIKPKQNSNNGIKNYCLSKLK